MTFDGRLPNAMAAVVRGLYCLCSQKPLHEITVNIQG